MPTENLSSNTDPRDVFIRLNPLGLGESELRKDSTGFEDQRTHSDYLLFLAGYRETHPEPLQHTEQHQGEPVGEVVAFGKGLHEIAWAAGRMPKLGAKLYTHADTGEVERLREENRILQKQMSERWADIDELRAQLAEQDALLRDSYAELLAIKAEIGFRGATIALIGRIDAALSASAKPKVTS